MDLGNAIEVIYRGGHASEYSKTVFSLKMSPSFTGQIARRGIF